MYVYVHVHVISIHTLCISVVTWSMHALSWASVTEHGDAAIYTHIAQRPH
jgi:hypothetical protein